MDKPKARYHPVKAKEYSQERLEEETEKKLRLIITYSKEIKKNNKENKKMILYN